MRSIRRILVAVKDPSSKSLPAVTKAAQLARALGAELELFHSISTPLYVDAYSPSEPLLDIERTIRRKCLEELEVVATSVRRKDLKVAVSAEWDYPIYEAVVRRAGRVKADLIVAERHAGRHLAPGLLQLTDWELLRLSPVPVLLVKTVGAYRRPAVLAALDPAHAYSKPAKLDDEILSVGSAVTDALGGTLHAVHAYSPTPIRLFQDLTTPDDTIARMDMEVAAQAKKGLDRALRFVEIPHARRHLVGRHPIDAIAQTARKTHSSIVVMGAISRSGLKRLFIGNTAESLLDQLLCDVLIVKPAHFAARVQRRRRGVPLAALVATPGM
jgi:universal stress protein E